MSDWLLAHMMIIMLVIIVLSAIGLVVAIIEEFTGQNKRKGK